MKKSIFLAFLLAIFTNGAQAWEHDLELATVVLNSANVSYLLNLKDDGIHVSTFGYKIPAETCEFLIKKGVNVNDVIDYSLDNETHTVVKSFTRC